MEKEFTTLSIKKETWARLNQRKAYPSQTFDTIINNLMDYEMSNVHISNEENGNNNEVKNPVEKVQDEKVS